MNYTYIVQCADGTYYTGWTNDLNKRLAAHNAGKGAKYTRNRRPVELVYAEAFEEKSQAMSREYQIKKMKRAEKEKMAAEYTKYLKNGGNEMENKSDSKIKVILWDIDGTLLNFLAAEKCAIRTCFEEFHLGECTDEMIDCYSAINKTYWERLERGELKKTEVLEGRFREFFTVRGIPAELAPAFNARYQICLGNTVCFEDTALETVKSLQGKVRQFAVTNGTVAAQRRKLANSGLDQLLEEAFISDEIGIEKPMMGFFDHVFAAIGSYKKEEIMIVGDSLTSDMQGGNNAGIRCCWYNPNGVQNQKGVRIDDEIRKIGEVMELPGMQIE